jgi:hypothetical protein
MLACRRARGYLVMTELYLFEAYRHIPEIGVSLALSSETAGPVGSAMLRQTVLPAFI